MEIDIYEPADDIINYDNLLNESVSAIVIDALSASSLSAGNVHVYGDIKIDDSLWADFGYFNTLSAVEVNAHLFTGDGSGIINIIPKSKTVIIGDGISNDYIINHNYNTLDIKTQIYDHVNENIVYTSVQNIDSNNIKVHFKNIPALNSYKVVIMATGNSN